MGTVYEGTHVRLTNGPVVAIKVSWSRPGPMEAWWSAPIEHRHVLSPKDGGRDEAAGLDWMAMPLGSDTLDRRIRRQPGGLPEGEALAIALALASGLEAVHRHGIFHADIKPSNVIFAQGEWKIGDFGLAQRMDALGPGWIGGTPGYWSPEQAAGEVRDCARADLYSLGVVIHEMLTGLRPPGGRIRGRAWRQILGKLLAPAPLMRYRSASDLLTDLERLAGSRPRTRLRVWGAAAAVLLTTCGAAAYGLWPNPRVVGDDAWPDLIFSNHAPRESWVTSSAVYFGGPWGFPDKPSALLPTSGAYGSAVGDFGSPAGPPDGVLDVAFASTAPSQNDQYNFVYLGGKAGYSAADVLLVKTPPARGVAAADFDGDGYTDLAVLTHGDSNDPPNATRALTYIFWNSPSGLQLDEPSTVPSPAGNDVTSGAFDATPGDELVVAEGWNYDDGPVACTIYGLSRRHPVPIAQVIVAFNISACRIADVDDDGAPDLVTAEAATRRNEEIAVYRGPTLADRAAFPAPDAVDVLARDIDGDGLIDLTYAGEYDADARSCILWQAPGVTDLPSRFAGERTCMTTPISDEVGAGDFDRDGRIDLVFSQRGQRDGAHVDSAIFYQRSARNFEPASIETRDAIAVTVVETRLEDP